jgi:hypothetical protein
VTLILNILLLHIHIFSFCFMAPWYKLFLLILFTIIFYPTCEFLLFISQSTIKLDYVSRYGKINLKKNLFPYKWWEFHRPVSQNIIIRKKIWNVKIFEKKKMNKKCKKAVSQKTPTACHFKISLSRYLCCISLLKLKLASFYHFQLV